jgi:hypothetical protein
MRSTICLGQAGSWLSIVIQTCLTQPGPDISATVRASPGPYTQKSSLPPRLSQLETRIRRTP